MEELLENTETLPVDVSETTETAANEEVPEAAAAPVPAQPSHTAALEQELEALRREKHRRQLLEEVCAQLTDRGIDPAFADFVLGEDSAQTRKRVEQFDRQLAGTLRRHLAAHLPGSEPRDFSVTRLHSRRRGIRKL